MVKAKKKHSLPVTDFQQLVDELGAGPFSILSDKALYSIKQMIRRAMEAGYWHGVASAKAQQKIAKAAKRRLQENGRRKDNREKRRR